ncbi:hypothetical protein [Rickettsiella massiliensis]|uniref:hypothetical protein n=1 Tax=Rickettsiella massiliensis TaxID=676517 RepID=UPI0012EA4610|nr:hypothetical protein [Rickettsiella massiliensis]
MRSSFLLFIIEEIQELTQYCLASSYCQKLEEALTTEIRLTTEYTDTLRLKNKRAPQSHRVIESFDTPRCR